MKLKNVKDIEDCVDWQLKNIKKHYLDKYGRVEATRRNKEFYQGMINALAWVKVFAVKSLDYNPKKRYRGK